MSDTDTGTTGTGAGASVGTSIDERPQSLGEGATYLPPVDDGRREPVRFATAAGASLVGHLYRPPGADAGQVTPALAMAGPMTSVKEETLPHYAVGLADAGFTVLAYDPRGFGESDAAPGGPRQELDTAGQVEDLKNAVSYLAARDDVDADRLGLACVCLGAGYGLVLAAYDTRVKAAALIAGGYDIADTYLDMLGADGFADYMDNLYATRQQVHASGEPVHMPAVAGPPDFSPAAMPVQEAYEYYTRAQRVHAPNWDNRVTTASMEHLLSWNVVDAAHLVRRPLLVVHGTTDQLLPPQYAQQVYERAASEDKRMVSVPTDNHVQLYDQDPYVTQALDAVAPFLTERLA